MSIYEDPDAFLKLQPASDSSRYYGNRSASEGIYEYVEENCPVKPTMCSKKVKYLLIILTVVLGVLFIPLFGFHMSYYWLPDIKLSTSRCSANYTYFGETGFCYRVYIPEVTFDEAHETCVLEGSHLTSIHSAVENELINRLYFVKLTEYVNTVDIHKEKSEIWIGLQLTNGGWLWTDGTPTNYTNWATIEPRPWGKRVDNVEMVTTKHEGWSPNGDEWNDVEKSLKRAFICKKPSNSESTTFAGR